MTCFVKEVTVEGSNTNVSDRDLETLPLKPVSYTQAEIDGLTGMTAPEVVWNSTTEVLNFYNGTVWGPV